MILSDNNSTYAAIIRSRYRHDYSRLPLPLWPYCLTDCFLHMLFALPFQTSVDLVFKPSCSFASRRFNRSNSPTETQYEFMVFMRNADCYGSGIFPEEESQ